MLAVMNGRTATQTSNYRTKAQKEKVMKRGRGKRKDDMTFMISGTIWTKELQRQKELSEILLEAICCLDVCVIYGEVVAGGGKK